MESNDGHRLFLLTSIGYIKINSGSHTCHVIYLPAQMSSPKCFLGINLFCVLDLYPNIKFVGLILTVWFRETHITHKGTVQLSRTKRGSNSLFSEAISTAFSCPVRLFPQKLCQNTSIIRSGAALDIWQPIWNEQVLMSTPVGVNVELHAGPGDIHICWFNFTALAQENQNSPR